MPPHHSVVRLAIALSQVDITSLVECSFLFPRRVRSLLSPLLEVCNDEGVPKPSLNRWGTIDGVGLRDVTSAIQAFL
jgi:hypothetical protein